MTKASFLTLVGGSLAMQACFAGNTLGGELLSGPGLSISQAIEVCEASGQRQYLSMLVCPGNFHPTFKRVGSFGTRDPYPGDLPQAEADEILLRLISDPTLHPGEPDFHMVDGYEVVCPGSSTMIYMDLYHCGQEFPTTAPPGFTLLR